MCLPASRHTNWQSNTASIAWRPLLTCFDDAPLVLHARQQGVLRAGDHDDRVVPLHSHKLTATLQHVLAGGPDAPQRNPLLTRVEVRAGHGAGGGPSVSA